MLDKWSIENNCGIITLKMAGTQQIKGSMKAHVLVLVLDILLNRSPKGLS